MFTITIFLSLIISAIGITFISITGAGYKSLRDFGLIFLAITLGLNASVVVKKKFSLSEVSTGIPHIKVKSFEGTILEDAQSLPDGRSLFTLMLKRVSDGHGTEASASGKVVIYYRGTLTYGWGAEIRVDSALKSQKDSGKEDFFSYPGEEDIQFLYWSSPLLKLRYLMKEKVLRSIQKMGKPAAGLFGALFLGVRDDLGVLEREYFRRAGSMHILALSGMHLGIIAGLIFFLLSPIAGKRYSFFICLVILSCYILTTGLKPSLLRAGVMFFLFGFGRLIARETSPLNILFLAFIILAIAMPSSVNTLSFKLSFLALFGILVVSKRVIFYLNPFLPRAVALSISASIGAQALTSILVIPVFGVIYPVGIIASLLLAPLITVFIALGMLYIVLIQVPLMDQILRFLLFFIYKWVIELVKLFSLFPGLRIERNWEYTIYFISLLCFFTALFYPVIKNFKKRV